MTDLDLRLVRYFVAVAEHRHFGKASQQLRVAQPSLSRQVRKLEEQVGARLLDRTPQGTQLTSAGTAFLPRARSLLKLAEQASTEARAAADPSRLVIGRTNIVVTPVVLEMRRRHPEADIQTLHLEWHNVREALLERRVDAAVARLPLATTGLDVTVLYDEPRVVVMAADHRLAGQESLTLADIADEPMPEVDDPALNAYWRLDPRPDGRRAPGGPKITRIEDKFEFVATGQAIAILPAAPHYGRPDLISVPLLDAPPGHVVLAHRSDDNSRLVKLFRKYAQAILRPR
ncbi:LysR family transcriptional regulator [Kineosporia babensis]|uniref:LysR substrate-binding domain-containing protein n=1 Tax=Kineosporia babensis TaxID=499548 RepID=A0A9X1N870_9ACTN|nr:LysR family transcriptional regulator [Kineosporia babensis]MCD5310162.1 LysR substrate-binding domain-containing protein [Kineosporia babensis]